MNELFGGMVPPQAIDIEEAVLGSLIMFEEAQHQYIRELDKDSFYKDTNRHIFKAIEEMYDDNVGIDMLTLVNALKQKQILETIGGPYAIKQLVDKSSEWRIKEYILILKQKQMSRDIIKCSLESAEKAYSENDDVFDIRDQLMQEVSVIGESNRKAEVSVGEQMQENLKETIARRNGDVKSLDITTKITKLDNYILGFGKTENTIIAARPGMGKTALVVTLLRNIGFDQKIPCALFSLEMSTRQITIRMQSMVSGLPFNNISSGQGLSDGDINLLEHVANEYENAPVYIDDTPSISLQHLRSKLYEMKHKYGIEIAFVDYIQLMQDNGNHSNREGEISSISRGLKNIAKELDIAVVPLSQLNRSVETRGGDKRPLLSDLRESGSIEQDADKVIFLYRPAYYDMTIENEPEDYAEAIVAKHRNGPVGTAKLKFDSSTMEFTNYGDEFNEL